ncbi:VanZ like family protein [Amycolatopsis sp. YIM 10]|nr:VanZ like family protein [Amycolatopsis sp. YIM 10]
MDALLRDFGILITIGFMALPFTAAGWFLLAAQRRRRRRPARFAVLTAGADSVITLIGTLAFVLVAMPIPGASGSTLQLAPGTDLDLALSGQGSLWQIAGNLVLLLPLGALLPLRVAALRTIPRVTVAALSVSLLVETMQFVIQAGRVTSADDVLLNTAGATIGAALTRNWWPRPPVIPPQLRRGVGGQHRQYAARSRVVWSGTRCARCGVDRPAARHLATADRN